MFLLFTSFLPLLFETSLATCKYKYIHNASELIEFSNDVNNGTIYHGYTVYLVADIDLNDEPSQQFNPIGYKYGFYDSYEDYKFFNGVFDGQGYVIKNFVLSSSLFMCAGLFGYSKGLTVRNAVLDDSCSVSSSHTDEYCFTGGFFGNCDPFDGPCSIENSVNMASIKFSGSTTTDNMWVGGLGGYIPIEGGNHESKVMNCVNYGTVSNSGSSCLSTYIGGVIGEIYPATDRGKECLYNCVNYGAISNTGYASNNGYYIGGISSIAWGSSISNCVSVGEITTSYGSAGSIIGTSYKHSAITTMSHCYWTTGTKCSSYIGYNRNINPSYIYQVESISSTNVNELNTYASGYSWNEWTYNQNSAAITFVVLDGKGFTYSSQFFPVPEPARRGYAFLFWCVGQNSTDECSNKYAHSDSGFTGETTLYAQWVITNCTVVFDVDGGDDLPENERNRTKVYEEEIGELPTTSRRGYTFGGWFTAYGERFANSSLINNVCNCSLIAQWIPNNYTVILDVNRGNKHENNTFTATFNRTYDFLVTPSRDGFDFDGWFDDDVTGEEITSETVVNITSTQTLYAHWSPKKYTVTLDVNGGDELPEGEREVEVLADKAHDSLATPTRRGYTFAGWYTEDNGLITDNTATTAIITRDQVLCAHWTPNNYTVTFDVNGGNELGDEEVNITFTFNTTYDYLPTPLREGYSFSEWFTADGEVITDTNTVYITQDCTFYANWTANTYTIIFNVNGGDNIANITVTYNSSYDCLPTPVKEGYTFMWWYIEGTKEIVYSTTTVLTACNHTLCAGWNRNNVIFDVNGGEELEERTKEIIYDGNYDTLPSPTRTGYTFDGWFNEDGKEITKDTKVEVVSNQVLRAEWTANKYTMTLDVNGGDAFGEGKNTITVTYDTLYGSIPTPTRTGYTFIGWYTENNELITINTVVTDACHCTLHANWTADTYIIFFDVNGGEELGENEKNTTVAYDDTYDSLPEPMRTGYTFDGWFNEDGEEIKVGMRVEITKDQTFRAEWTANNYTVRLDANGGELACEEITVTYNSTYDSLPEPIKGGYNFDGWFNEDGEEIKKETKVTIAKNQTLRAHWSEIVAPTKWIEIVFGKGDLTKEEIEDILKKFTNANFEIAKIDNSKSGETSVIIRFNDVESAEKFLTSFNESSDSSKYFIRGASFNSGVDNSFSAMVYPFMLFGISLI